MKSPGLKFLAIVILSTCLFAQAYRIFQFGSHFDGAVSVATFFADSELLKNEGDDPALPLKPYAATEFDLRLRSGQEMSYTERVELATERAAIAAYSERPEIFVWSPLAAMRENPEPIDLGNLKSTHGIELLFVRSSDLLLALKNDYELVASAGHYRVIRHRKGSGSHLAGSSIRRMQLTAGEVSGNFYPLDLSARWVVSEENEIDCSQDRMWVRIRNTLSPAPEYTWGYVPLPCLFDAEHPMLGSFMHDSRRVSLPAGMPPAKYEIAVRVGKQPALHSDKDWTVIGTKWLALSKRDALLRMLKQPSMAEWRQFLALLATL